MQGVLQKDPRAFPAIIRLTERLVASIVIKLVKDTEEHKDLAQEIYLKTYKKLSGFQFQCKLTTWVAQISYNTCLDHLKKKKIPILDIQALDGEDGKRETSDYARSNSTEGLPILIKQRKEILQEAIDQLPPLYKTLITLYHQDSLSYEEIGAITGLPSGTVKNYLFRARKKMKDSLLLEYKKEEL